MRQLLPVFSLLLSTALLLIGHGMQLTLLPLRGAANGMSDQLIGLSASAYFAGFVASCLLTPGIIARVGHIRSFSILAATMISALLFLDLLNQWVVWILLRFMTGFAICGLYAVIESWLNSESTPQTRGKLLSIYTFIVLSSMTAGQFLINIGPADSAAPFTLAAVFLALAIVPVSLTSRMQPAPVHSRKIDFGLLYQRSRPAFFGALLSGLVVGSFWSLGAVFASRYSENQTDVTWFMSFAIAGGALLQYPIGWLSDKIDRRYVLTLLCIAGAASSSVVAISTQESWFLIAVFIFGATVMPLYAIALATAADVASSEEFVSIGTSVLLLNALGAAIAPIGLGQIMTAFDATALFWSFAVLCALFSVLFAILTRKPRNVTVDEQTPFTPAGSEVAPESFEMDPRGPEEEEGAQESVSGAQATKQPA